MKRTKRLTSLLIVVCLILTMIPAAFAASTGKIVLTINSPSMTVNGVSKKIDENGTTAVLDKGGYTMLPLRAVVEAMGGSLTWDATARAITMVKDSQTVKVTVGSKDAYVNGTLKKNALQYAPRINAQGRTLVHIRALEMFTGTACTWDQTTKQVTVTYTDNTPVISSKNYRIDVINKSGAEIKTLQYGLTGTYQYASGNVLKSNLKNNGTASFYISVPSNATSKIYDFYTEDASTGSTKLYSGLNLNSVNAYATIVIEKDRKFQQANDKTITVSSGDTELKIVNKYKNDIEELYMATSSSGLKNADNLLASETVESKDDTKINIDLDGNKSWYFLAVDEDGKEFKSGKVSFSSAKAKSGTLTLSTGGKLTLGSSSSDGETVLTFKNKSDYDIESIYMAKKKSDVEDADDILDDVLEEDDSVEVDFDLEGGKSWYITVEFDDSKKSSIKEKSLSFEYKDPASATIEISNSSVSVKSEKKASASGELMLALVNDTDTDIKAAYLVEDEDDFDVDDEEDILDSKIKAGEFDVLTDVADVDEYDLILYYDTDDDDYSYTSVDLSDATDSVTIHVTKFTETKVTAEVYPDDDDTILVGLYNDSGKKLSPTVYEYDTGKSNDKGTEIESLSSFADGEYVYFELDTSDYPDILIDSSAGKDYVEDLDDEYSFVMLTIDQDGDLSLEDMDDLD